MNGREGMMSLPVRLVCVCASQSKKMCVLVFLTDHSPGREA